MQNSQTFRRMFIPAIAGIAVVGVVSALRAQTPATDAKAPAFDVASIRPNASIGGRLSFRMPADRFEAANISLRELVKVAFGEPGQMLPDYQVSGGPNWIQTDRFDVRAIAAGDLTLGSVDAAKKLMMLRELLADRFRLRIHHGARVGARYALVPARSDQRLGPRLRRSDVDCDAFASAHDHAGAEPAAELLSQSPCRIQLAVRGAVWIWRMTGQSMAVLAYSLSHQLDRPVVDRTGLVGRFDLELEFNPPVSGGSVDPPGVDRQPSLSDGSSIFTAVQEQLELKLESTKGPVEVLVIDHAEKPSED
jgi:uncharacterized protein (TIGR03435 family)